MFRKYLMILSAAVMCCGAFAGCGSKSSSSESSAVTSAASSETASDNTQETTETVTASQEASSGENDQTAGSGSKNELTPESAKGGDITGQWVPDKSLTSLDSFIDFGKDGAGTLYVDLSAMVSFENGKFNAMGMEAAGDDLVIEKDSVKAYLNHYDEDSLLIQLDRIDGGDCTASLDGEYKLASGRLVTIITAYIDGEFSGDSGDLPITAVVEGKGSLLKLEGAFSYTVEDNRLNVAVMSELADKLGAINSKDIYFTAEKDRLLIVTGDGDSTVMTRRVKDQ